MVLAKLKTRSLHFCRQADCTKYKYDVFGNRIEQIEDADGAGGGASVTTRFAWEGAGVLQDAWGNRTTPVGTENWNIWADLNGSNGLVMRYVRGDAVDQLFSRVKADGTVAHYLTDRMQSTRQMLDVSGTVANTITYDGFGNVLSETDAAFGDRWKWTGREYNNYTGLQYNRARYYSGESGRWVSEDPIRIEAGDYNNSRYVLNSSCNYIDPSGNQVINPFPKKDDGRRWGDYVPPDGPRPPQQPPVQPISPKGPGITESVTGGYNPIDPGIDPGQPPPINYPPPTLVPPTYNPPGNGNEPPSVDFRGDSPSWQPPPWYYPFPSQPPFDWSGALADGAVKYVEGKLTDALWKTFLPPPLHPLYEAYDFVDKYGRYLAPPLHNPDGSVFTEKQFLDWFTGGDGK